MARLIRTRNSAYLIDDVAGTIQHVEGEKTLYHAEVFGDEPRKFESVSDWYGPNGSARRLIISWPNGRTTLTTPIVRRESV